MDAERWAQIKPIFSAAAGRPATERPAFIRSQCNGDESLAVEIESLLAANDQAGSFIEAFPNQEATAHLEDLPLEPPPLARYVEDVPAELDRIVTKALRKDREERYQTIKDLLIDLRDFKQELESRARQARSPAASAAGEAATLAEPALRTAPDEAARPTSSAEYLIGEIKRHKRGAAVVLAVLVVGLAAIASLAPLIYRRLQAEASMVLLPAGGGEEQPITSPTTLTEVAYDWSADGAGILASSDSQTAGRTAICLFPVSAAPRAETQMRVVTSHPEYNLWQGHYSPDERWIMFLAIKATESGVTTIYVLPAAGGEWRRIIEGKYWDDSPHWSPDGRTIYFVPGRSGFFNVWGMRFDPTGGQPVGEAFRVTAFESPGHMMSPRMVQLIGISLASDRLVLPITEVSGSIWILENVDR